MMPTNASISTATSKTAPRMHLERVASEGMEEVFRTVAKARDFHEGRWIEQAYYRRHLVETVLRIRLNNEVDSYSLFRSAARDNKLAMILAKYRGEEFGHEETFLADVERFGLTKSDVDAMAPFPATDEVIGVLYLAINRDGPLPTMLWNWFVEWYSDRYNKVITESAASAWGEEKVKGSIAHIFYDESHDHDELMWSLVQRAIDGFGDVAKAERYLRVCIELVARYFEQLYLATVPSALPEAADYRMRAASATTS